MDLNRRAFAAAKPGWLPPRATLRTYLVAIILAAALPLVAFMVVRILAEAELQRNMLMASLGNNANAVAVVVDREVTASRDALMALARADTLQQGDIAGFERQMRARGPLRHGRSRLALLDAQGRLVFETDGRQAAQAPASAEDEIAALARAGASGTPNGVLLSVLDAPPAQRGTWIGVNASTAAGERYVLASRMGLDVWQALLESAAPKGETYAAIFDDRHRIVARTIDAEHSVGQALPAAAVAGMAGRPSGTQKTERLGGGQTYVGWQMAGYGGWGVGVGIPAGPIDAMQRSTALWSVGFAAACLVLGVTLALRVARSVVHPLELLLRSDGNTPEPPIRVTEIAQLHEALRRSERSRDKLMLDERSARAEVEAASRAKDHLLGMLGHELRNPLNGIATSVEVLRAAQPGSAMAESARAVLGRQVRKLARMVDDLLDFGQVMADRVTLSMQPVDLSALVHRSVEAALPLAIQRAQHLRLDSRDPAWALADIARVEQVMAHLLENAIKHTPANGTITVRLAVVDGLVDLSVDDSGAGIDPALLSRMFEPFVQGELGLDRSTGGLGIGLALVKRVIELHGGSVYAQSSSKGSRFGWRLPGTAPPAATTETSGLHIAVIDDNADALASMRAMLELEGHRVSTATDGPSAVALLLGERPDLALVDIGLPGFDGHEVARRCRAAGHVGRMVAISGYGQAHDLARSTGEGFDAHLVKPLDLASIRSLTRSG